MAAKLETFLAKAIGLYSKGNSSHLGDRSQYIGASDIAGCPRKAVLSRQIPIEHTVTTQLRFAWGHLSQELFSRFFSIGGLQFEEEVEIIHPNNSRIRCHIDFLFKGKNRWHVVEKKACDKIPEEPYQSWVDQLQVQMGMLKNFHPEASKSNWPIGGSVLAAKPLPKEHAGKFVNGVREFNSFTPNDIVFESLMQKANHILAAIDGKEEARCETSLLCGSCPYEYNCPARKAPQVPIPQDVVEAAKVYLELMEEKKKLEATIDALKDSLLNYTGRSFARSFDGVTIRSYEFKESVTVDSKKLKKDYPEAYKACTKPKAGYVKLEVSRPKQEEPGLFQEAA